MTNATDSNTNTTPPSSAKKVLLALGVVLVAAAATFAVVQAADDSPTETDDVAVIESTPAPEPSPAVIEAPAQPTTTQTQPVPKADEPVATDAPVEQPTPAEPAVSEPADEAGETPVEQTPELNPVPVVIGQDENGEDIVILLEVTEACGTTFHQPLDADSLSFIRWEYDAPGLAPGTTIKVAFHDGSSQFTKVTDDQKIVVEQGITSYGDYTFPIVEWDEDELNSTSIAPDGSHTVDEQEGEASRTCLS